jgi:protoporphyrinogen oxidase
MKLVFVGSGPVSLLKAYLHAKDNPADEIVIIDLHKRVGGAWYSDISETGAEIECGCHIWSYEPTVYEYFKSEFGLKLIPYSPNAVFVGNIFHLPYSLKNTIDSYKHLLKNSLKGKFSVNRNIKNDPRFHKKIFGKKNLYPLKGSVELINSMKSKLDGFSHVTFDLGKQVQDILIDDSVTLIMKSGEKLNCDKVILTSVSEIETVQNSEKKIELVQDRRDYIHLLLASDEPFKKKISYWRLMNDEVIHRFSDISYQTDNKENLMLAGIKPDPFYEKTEEELADYCRQYLVKKKVIKADQDLRRIKTHVFPTYYIKEGLRDQINQLDKSKLELIHSTDIIYGFFRTLKAEGII